MEVHPPEHPIHTVREFLIHMFAIILGLLIAIGLEQTVEAIHHHHQRHQLEEDMRAEAETNVKILTAHLDANIPELVQYRAAVDAVRDAVPQGGFVDIVLPPRVMPEGSSVLYAPERSVWSVAQANGTAALLPEPLAQVYARVDFQSAEDNIEVDKIRVASALLTRFEISSGYALRPGAKLHLSLAQRDDLLAALSEETQQLYALLRRDNIFLLDCQAIVSGVQDVNSIRQNVELQRLRIFDYNFTVRGK